MKTQQTLVQLLGDLLIEGDAVLKTKWQPGGNWVSGPPSYVDLASFSTWRARCKLLASLLGRAGKCWESELTAGWPNKVENAISTQSTLSAVKSAIDMGLLLEMEDLILAEAFANLMEQADYLLQQGYFLASGVVLRAVLEERLRRLVDSNGVALSKPRPTLNDYNTELYKGSVYDKITFKEVELLAAIGNKAAHNEPGLFANEVSTMRDGLIKFLEKFSR